MPTDVINKIGASNSPVTMDYSTVQAWEDACPANLVTADQRWIGECYNQGSLSSLVIAGETTDATRYLWLRTATGASFRDNANVRTNALYPNSANGVFLGINTNYAVTVTVAADFTRFSYLQIENLGANYAITLGTSTMFDSCIVHSDRQATPGAFSMKAYQCLFIGSGQHGDSPGPDIGDLYGCTIINLSSTSTVGSHGNNYGATKNHRNCAFFGYTAHSTGAAGGVADYDGTDATTNIEGAHTVTGLVASAQFVSSTNDFRAVSSGGLKAGTPDATNSPVDITGLARDASVPYIGCWEVAAVGGGRTTKNIRAFPLGMALGIHIGEPGVCSAPERMKVAA